MTYFEFSGSFIDYEKKFPVNGYFKILLHFVKMKNMGEGNKVSQFRCWSWKYKKFIYNIFINFLRGIIEI